MNSQQKVSAHFAASRGVEALYQGKLDDLHQLLSYQQRRRSAALAYLAGCLAAFLAVVLGSGHIRFSAIAVIPVAGMLASLWEFATRQRVSAQIAHRCEYYERGLDRLRRNWDALEPTGDEFARSSHLYQFDLQILGKRSLFSLLCTTRSKAGAARLAGYLLDPADLQEARARQQAVRELKNSTALREQIALLGDFQFQGCDAETFREWMETPVLRVPAAISILLAVFGSVVLLSAVAGFAQLLAWPLALAGMLPAVLLQAIIAAPMLRAVRTRLRTLRSVARECSVLRQGLRLIENQDFASAKLQDLRHQLSSSSAVLHVRRLERLFWAIAQRDKDLFILPSLLASAGTQLVLAAERWRARHQEELRRWIDLWAEFDALNAIAAYAYENPEHVFPEFVDEAAGGAAEGRMTLHLRGLGHPLLPLDRCMRSDVFLSESPRFWVLSGSNMAGKSTLLRAVGINAVLAYAGAPIRASDARLSRFCVCASVGVSDSLLDGKSKFLAETERLMCILDKTRAGIPVLFLIDEILSGTNSHDRRLTCESLVGALISGGGVGILSTHDLALTAIADQAGQYGLNCCMESDDPDDPLHFDYVVKPGISHRSSAMAIIRLLGIRESPG